MVNYINLHIYIYICHQHTIIYNTEHSFTQNEDCQPGCVANIIVKQLKPFNDSPKQTVLINNVMLMTNEDNNKLNTSTTIVESTANSSTSPESMILLNTRKKKRQTMLISFDGKLIDVALI